MDRQHIDRVVKRTLKMKRLQQRHLVQMIRGTAAETDRTITIPPGIEVTPEDDPRRVKLEVDAGLAKIWMLNLHREEKRDGSEEEDHQEEGRR